VTTDELKDLFGGIGQVITLVFYFCCVLYLGISLSLAISY
jgi:hypothetical protein